MLLTANMALNIPACAAVTSTGPKPKPTNNTAAARSAGRLFIHSLLILCGMHQISALPWVHRNVPTNCEDDQMNNSWESKEHTHTHTVDIQRQYWDTDKKPALNRPLNVTTIFTLIRFERGKTDEQATGDLLDNTLLVYCIPGIVGGATKKRKETEVITYKIYTVTNNGNFR